MRLISAEYDAYNRKFKLLDSTDAERLRDGETYLFMAFSNEDLIQKSTTDFDRSEIEQADLVWFPS